MSHDFVASFTWCETCDTNIGRGDCEACERRRRDGRLKRSGLPDRLRGLTWTDATKTPSAALNTYRAWASGELSGLYVEGPVGAGKTWLAAIAANERINVGHEVHWISVPAALATVDGAFGEARDGVLERLNDAGAIVLDDIDKAPRSERAASLLFVAINERLEAGAPLLITSNAKPSTLAAHFRGAHGQAIGSRIAGYCRRLQLTGDDRRLGKAA